MSEVLLAVDPGTQDLGWAVFIDGKLAHWGLLKNEYIKAKNEKTDSNEKTIAICRQVTKLVTSLTKKHGNIAKLVSEYSTATFTASHTAALVRMGSVVGSFIACMPEKAEVVLVRPQTWKTRRSKESTHDEYITPEVARELVGIDKYKKAERLDILDAICIGLYATNNKPNKGE